MPNYGDIMSAVADARAAIDILTKTVEKREDAYDQIRPHALALKMAHDKLVEYQSDAANALEEHNRLVLESQQRAEEARRAERRFWIRLATMGTIAILGLLATVILAIWS